MVTQVANWNAIIRGSGTWFYGDSGSHETPFWEQLLHALLVETQVAIYWCFGTNNNGDSSSRL